MTVRLPYIFLSELDIGDPNFPAKCMAWRAQTRSEIDELVIRSKDTITTSRTLLAEIDRVLAQNRLTR
jgi:hypothetical protein